MTDVGIVNIPVNAEAFEKFYALFQQYNEQLDEQPSAWKKLNEAMTKSSPAAGKVASRFADTAGSSDAVVKSLSASTKAMKDLLSATQKSNASMSALMESSTGVAKGVLGAAAGLGAIGRVMKFFGPVGRIAEFAAATATGLGDLALHSAGSISNTARAAFGAVGPGGSRNPYGAFQNTQAQLSPFLPNPGANLQSVAAAQYNPMAFGQLGLFGVTPGQSTSSAMATILRQAVGTLRSTHNSMLPQVTFAEQLLGASPTDLISLANGNPKDLSAALAAMQNPALIAKQNVAGGVISSDQSLLRSWAVSLNTASAKFGDALSTFNPAVDKFGKGIADFATWVDGKVRSGQSWSSILNGALGKGTSGIGALFPGLPPALGGLGNGPGGINPATGLPNTAPPPSPYNTPSKTSGTNFRAVMDQFMSAGYSRNFAAGMASQANSESGFNAAAVNITDGQKHAGLFQWSGTRRAQILKGTGIDVWTDTNPQDQVKASIWELQNTQIPAAMKIALAPNAGAAAIAADKYYEVSGDNMVQQGIRGLVAQGYAAIGPDAPSAKPVLHDLPPDVKSLLARLATRPAPPVKVTVTNSTSAKVAVSANAAAHG